MPLVPVIGARGFFCAWRLPVGDATLAPDTGFRALPPHSAHLLSSCEQAAGVFLLKRAQQLCDVLKRSFAYSYVTTIWSLAMVTLQTQEGQVARDIVESRHALPLGQMAIGGWR